MSELTRADIELRKYKATLNRVHVRMAKTESVSKGGIQLPENYAHKEKMACDAGTIVDMGPDAFSEYQDNRIKVGSVVLFAKYAGAIVPGSEERERIINDVDIYGLAEESST